MNQVRIGILVTGHHTLYGDDSVPTTSPCSPSDGYSSRDNTGVFSRQPEGSDLHFLGFGHGYKKPTCAGAIALPNDHLKTYRE